MRFVFVSNYLNHHQIPFCRAMERLMEGSFAFIQTEPVEEERLQMGWNGDVKEPYLRMYEKDPEGCQKLIDEAQILMFGGTDDESYIQTRLRSGRLILRYTERLYKTGQWKAVSPRGLRRKYLDHTRYRNSPVYMLCAGAYVPSDLHIVRAYPGKMFCWGYFPEAKTYDVAKLLAEKGYRNDKGERLPYLLWSGRMIDWKHPELVLETAKYLKEKGLPFHLDMIGGGAMEAEIKAMAERYGLQDLVSFPGFLPPEKVREYMEKADIYLLVSDRQEGWGAVANESMNSACALVADHMVGAAPYLIRHGRNGLVYRDGVSGLLFQQVEELVKDLDRCRQLGENAYETIHNEWNAQRAAERLCALIDRIQETQGDGKEAYSENKRGKLRRNPEGSPGDSGQGFVPCQSAPVISERAMYRYLTQSHS